MVLWDLNLVIRFPPGSTIIIPSAMVRHSNTTIGPDEKRYSIAQYSAGGLFRWVANGFQTAERAGKSETSKEAQAREARLRWGEGLARLSRVSEFSELRPS